MKRRITFLLIFSILLSTIAPATKSYAISDKNNSSTSYNEESNVTVTNDGIFINGKFFTQYEFTSLLDNAILVSENNSNGISTRNVGVVDAGEALIAGTWFIPGVGEVVVTAAGVVIVAGAVVAVGSWAYKAVTNWFKNRAYNKAKENGTKTNDHSTQTGSSLPTKSRPNSSKDLKDSKGIKQRRYYDKNGDADLDIDYRHGGNGKHKFPHRHKWTNGKRGPAY